MPDFPEALAWIAVAAFLVAAGGAALGGLLIWTLIQRSAVDPADGRPDVFDVFDGVEEETVEVPVIAPILARWFTAEPVVEPEPEPEPERAVAHRPMSAMERLEGPTRRIIRTRDGYEVEPYWFGGRHRTLESRCRVPSFLFTPQATAEFPEVGHHRSGEYPVLDGAR